MLIDDLLEGFSIDTEKGVLQCRIGEDIDAEAYIEGIKNGLRERGYEVTDIEKNFYLFLKRQRLKIIK